MTPDVSWPAANVRRLQRHALLPPASSGTDPAEIAATVERCPTGAWDMQKFLLDSAQADDRCRVKHAKQAQPMAAD